MTCERYFTNAAGRAISSLAMPQVIAAPAFRHAKTRTDVEHPPARRELHRRRLPELPRGCGDHFCRRLSAARALRASLALVGSRAAIPIHMRPTLYPLHWDS